MCIYTVCQNRLSLFHPGYSVIFLCLYVHAALSANSRIFRLIFHNRPESAYASSVTTSSARLAEEPGGGVKTASVRADQSLGQLLSSSRYYYFYCYCVYYYYYYCTSTSACAPADAKEYVDIRGTKAMGVYPRRPDYKLVFGAVDRLIATATTHRIEPIVRTSGSSVSIHTITGRVVFIVSPCRGRRCCPYWH